MSRRLSRHIANNAVAYLALFIALGGTSVAAVSLTRNAVKGKHIAKNAVTGPKVKNASLRSADFAPGQLPKGDTGQPGPPGAPGQPGTPGADASVTSRDSKPAEIATSSDTFMAFDGPSVTVQVPAGGANVVVGASVEVRNTEGGEPWAFLFEDGIGQNVRISETCNCSSAFETKRGGTTRWVPAGTHTYELRYKRHGAGTSEFRNRILAVSVLK